MRRAAGKRKVPPLQDPDAMTEVQTIVREAAKHVTDRRDLRDPENLSRLENSELHLLQLLCSRRERLANPDKLTWSKVQLLLAETKWCTLLDAVLYEFHEYARLDELLLANRREKIRADLLSQDDPRMFANGATLRALDPKLLTCYTPPVREPIARRLIVSQRWSCRRHAASSPSDRTKR